MTEEIKIPTSYSLPSTPQAFLETFFPVGLVHDERGIVGVWCVFLDSIFSDTKNIVTIDGIEKDCGYIGIAVRTKAGHPFGCCVSRTIKQNGDMETWPSLAISFAEKALDNESVRSQEDNFPVVLRKVGIISPYGSIPTRHVTFKRILDHYYPCDCETNTSVASSHLAKLEPFAATLDQEVQDFVYSMNLPVKLPSRIWLDDKIWNGIDSTFTPTAPLRAAIKKMPQHVDLISEQWRRHPWKGEIDLTDIIAKAIISPKKNEYAKAPLAFVRKFMSRLPQITEASRQFPPPNTYYGSNYGFMSRESQLACLTSRLPLDWLPSDAHEWESLAKLSETLWAALQFLPTEPVQHIINASGRWSEYVDTLSKASGGMDVFNAFNDVSDLDSAFCSQILRPSIARSFGNGSALSMNGEIPRYLLFKGMSLTRILETSNRWHRHQAAIDNTISTFSPELDFSNWRAGLPNWESNGLQITVLTTTNELRDEGRIGVNLDGTSGLAHCVGGYSRHCRSGCCRILSFRRQMPGVGFERFSTAEISTEKKDYIGFLDVVQHRGLRNIDAPPETEAMLVEYLEKCRSGRLAVDTIGLTPLPSSDPVSENCGYDWRVPGNIEKAIAAWAPCLPRQIREMSPDEIAESACDLSPRLRDFCKNQTKVA